MKTNKYAGIINASAVLLLACTVAQGRAFSGNQQVGIGYFQNIGAYHAMVWAGTAASAIDLNPAGWIHSDVVATNGIQQVGSGKVQTTVGDTHALLWSGTANSFVDLGALLPAGTGSRATYIDSSGHVFGLAASGNLDYAIEWAPVPEPSTIFLVTIAFASLSVRRCKSVPHNRV